MELKTLEGTIIGIVSNENEVLDYNEKLVKDIVKFKTIESLKMVNLEESVLDKKFEKLGSRDKNKVILASKLNDDDIILYDFSKGMLKKDLDYFKRVFKRISNYGKRIILFSKDANLFINLVDTIYLLNNGEVSYKTTDIFDPALYIEMDKPKIVEFLYLCEENGINLDEYTDINELIKAIYRIKS